jgi:hypothetical protein
MENLWRYLACKFKHNDIQNLSFFDKIMLSNDNEIIKKSIMWKATNNKILDNLQNIFSYWKEIIISNLN